MGFNGGRADGQPSGDLRIIQSFNHQDQDFTLALRQVEARCRGLGGCMDQRLSGLGGKGGAAAMRCTDGLGNGVFHAPRLDTDIDDFRHVVRQRQVGIGLHEKQPNGENEKQEEGF